MMVNKDNNVLLDVKSLFSGKDKYYIPIYQRKYAWEEDEVKQLIMDIADYAKLYSNSPNNEKKNYYIGNLIVLYNSATARYEIIDGQQRLTTLYLILSAIKNTKKFGCELDWFQKDSLIFDHRKDSDKALDSVFDGDESFSSEKEEHIVRIYKKCDDLIVDACTGVKISIADFVDYLLKFVRILRISLPSEEYSHSYRNHYFEVLNSRGVQLEQHEIVKADLMSHLSTKDSVEQYAFDVIWQACSNMERYVHNNLNVAERYIIFPNSFEGRDYVDKPFESTSKKYLIDKFDSIAPQLWEKRIERIKAYNAKGGHEEEETRQRSLAELMCDFSNGVVYEMPKEDFASRSNDEEVYYSTINFPNFLLHVLRLIRPNDFDIVLDDKKLDRIFSAVISKEPNKKKFAKEFIMNLLLCRFLFDRYVVRSKKDEWTLNRVTYYYDKRRNSTTVKTETRTFGEESKEIIQLETMFHTSTTAMIYKNWLQVVLQYARNNINKVKMSGLKDRLLQLAKVYMLDRYFLPTADQVDFMDMLYKNDLVPQHSLPDDFGPYINCGTQVPNFIFNYYEYLIWEEQGKPDYKFIYRTSVEHFFPQHPDEQIKVHLENKDSEGQEKDNLNSFGNLALIRGGDNSKFSNAMPSSKIDMDFIIDTSLKLREMSAMMDKNLQKKAWLDEQIMEEEKRAIKRFKAALKGSSPE